MWSTVPVGGTSVEAIIEKNHTIGKEDNKIEKNVLLIDDNKINIVVASRMLTSIGCKIDVAMSGYEGIEKACENRYDIIFMDHLMPGIDGVEALSMLQSDGRNKNNGVPIISLTANATVGVREFYLEAGFHDYISKPIEYEKLEGIITKYANNRERIVDK